MRLLLSSTRCLSALVNVPFEPEKHVCLTMLHVVFKKISIWWCCLNFQVLYILTELKILRVPSVTKKGTLKSLSPCRFVNFSLLLLFLHIFWSSSIRCIHFEGCCAFVKMDTLSWENVSVSIYWSFLSWCLLCLKLIYSPAFLWLVFAWHVFFYLFIINVAVSMCLKYFFS